MVPVGSSKLSYLMDTHKINISLTEDIETYEGMNLLLSNSLGIAFVDYSHWL